MEAKIKSFEHTGRGNQHILRLELALPSSLWKDSLEEIYKLLKADRVRVEAITKVVTETDEE